MNAVMDPPEHCSESSLLSDSPSDSPLTDVFGSELVKEKDPRRQAPMMEGMYSFCDDPLSSLASEESSFFENVHKPSGPGLKGFRSYCEEPYKVASGFHPSSDYLYQDGLFSNRAYCCMSYPYRRSLDLDQDHLVTGSRLMSDNDLRHYGCPCCGGTREYVSDRELLFDRDSDSFYLPSYQRYFRSYSNVQDQDDYPLCRTAMRYVTADDVLLKSHQPYLSGFASSEVAECCESEGKMSTRKVDGPESDSSNRGNTTSGSFSLCNSDASNSDSSASGKASYAASGQSSYTTSRKSSYATSRSLTTGTLPKPGNTQNNGTQASSEVKKLPPFVTVGRGRVKKGPKKYYPLSNEKPGNPDEIDPTVNPRVFSGKKPKKNMDYSRFIIDISKVRSGEESRLTLMLKNIPNGFTQELMLRILDTIVPNKYDFFYMPVDFKTNCNLGFGYVSMVDNASVVKLYDSLNRKRWPNTPSSKICEVVFARMQGRNDMQRLCQDWAIMQLPDKYKPVFFEKSIVKQNGMEVTVMKRITKN